MYSIIVDTLGGDNGSAPIIKAIKEFVSLNPDTHIIAVGNEEELKEIKDICEIIHAPDIVPMEAGPLEVMRMKNSSLYVAVKTMKEKNYDAIVSCGSTGGFLSAATLILKTAPGVKRAALVSPFPTKIKGQKVVILDIGANNENSPGELVQFATMGEIYAKSVLKIEEPRTFLLANGTEEGKGSPTGKAAYKLLKGRPGFKGNIEARNVMSGEADVVVADGYSGNILLKSAEGTAKIMSNMIKGVFKKNIWTKIGYLHVRKGIKDMTETMDYKSTGGAMLLGINGVVVKAHGNSDDYAFHCALNVAKKMIESKVCESIGETLKNE